MQGVTGGSAMVGQGWFWVHLWKKHVLSGFLSLSSEAPFFAWMPIPSLRAEAPLKVGLWWAKLDRRYGPVIPKHPLFAFVNKLLKMFLFSPLLSLSHVWEGWVSTVNSFVSVDLNCLDSAASTISVRISDHKGYYCSVIIFILHP